MLLSAGWLLIVVAGTSVGAATALIRSARLQ
jgi:hypothetical protein